MKVPLASGLLLIVIIVLSIAGMADSGYALRLHYAEDDDSFCNIGPQFNCDVVNTSKYSEIGGLPVAGIGFAGYLLFAFLAASLLAGVSYRGLGLPTLLGAALFGVGFSFYLTWVELFVLETVCILCVISQALVFLILAAALGVAVISGRTKDE